MKPEKHSGLSRGVVITLLVAAFLLIVFQPISRFKNHQFPFDAEKQSAVQSLKSRSHHAEPVIFGKYLAIEEQLKMVHEERQKDPQNQALRRLEENMSRSSATYLKILEKSGDIVWR